MCTDRLSGHLCSVVGYNKFSSDVTSLEKLLYQAAILDFSASAHREPKASRLPLQAKSQRSETKKPQSFMQRRKKVRDSGGGGKDGTVAEEGGVLATHMVTYKDINICTVAGTSMAMKALVLTPLEGYNDLKDVVVTRERLPIDEAGAAKRPKKSPKTALDFAVG